MRQFFCARNLFREFVVFTITLQRSFTNKAAAFDAEMFLCDRERVTAADFGHLHGLNALRASNSNMRIRCCSQKIAIKTSLLCKPRSFLQIAACIGKLYKLRHFARPTERNGNGVVGMPGGHERCNDKLPFHHAPAGALFIDRDLQQIARFDAERFCVFRTDQRRIVPTQLRDWVG